MVVSLWTPSSLPRVRRSPGSRRPRPFRTAWLPGCGVDTAAGRGTGGPLRTRRATTSSGRSPSTPTSSRSLRSRCGSPTSTASSSVRRAHRPSRWRWWSRSTLRGTAPCAGSAMRRFTPRAIRSRHEEIDRIAVEILDDLAATADADEFDFVERIAAPLPIAVISWILGVPRDDWQLLFHWTNEVIGKDDPEFRRPGETPGQTIRRARGELHGYLNELIEQRRRRARRRYRQPADRRGDRRRSRSPRCSSSTTASSSSRPATRRPAMPSAVGCSPSPSTGTSGSD